MSKAKESSMRAGTSKDEVAPQDKSSQPRKTSYTSKLLVTAITLSALAFLVSRDQSGTLDTYTLCSNSGSQDIYTVDAQNTKVQCIVVKNGWITDSGLLGDIQERWNDTASGEGNMVVKWIPSGTVVLPGMSDSHCHILEYGASRQIPLSTGKNVRDTVSLVEEYIRAHPDLAENVPRVVEGWGWDHASWDVEKLPTWRDFELNPITANHKIILQSRDGHALWVSRAALADSAPFPDEIEGGVIVRDENNEPTGVFIDSAQDLIKRPVLTQEDLERQFTTTVNDALKHGLTSLHDAGFKPESLAFFRRQAEAGKLPLRIYGMTFFDEYAEYWGDQRAPLVGAGSGRLTARSVKIFADGALRTGGAALYEPYADNPSTRGAMRISTELLHKVVPRFLKDGWQVNVHAIGDRANGIVLDAFEAALQGANVTALRPRLEHAQIMTKADMNRLGKLGVIASVQPTHVIGDMWFAQDRLGPERVKGLYAFRSIIDAGARVTLGSDFPVEGVNPLAGFYAAITRVGTDGTSPHGPGGWFPEQCLTREEALRGMTIDPAFASFTEDTLGSLEPGKRADFVVLSKDIMSIPASEVLETKVKATVLDGKVAYGAL
ncbi:amidohydrolase family-domain-containing protein [Crucibulum laeve]|uniref:Amidohydrolase family-domain-containing protein n=1 Tax=Crucibulum laeve TaxID=68775 RepID=A0A5C3MH96_9AGAR|nr:amidohydrolase family-domain-containing protein [Crucibulum laeve]